MAKNKKTPMTIAIGDAHCLRAANMPIGEFDDGLIGLVEDLIYTMRRANGVGIAAPQVGLNIMLAVVLINKIPIVLINPLIDDRSDEVVSISEGCLSCPDVSVSIPRSKWIDISWYNVKGVMKKARFEGINAIIVQHELDHLNGKLITDYNVGATS